MMGNDWDVAANWVGNAVPTLADDVVFDITSTASVLSPTINGAAHTLKITSDYTGTIILQSLTVSQGTAGTSTIQGGTIDVWGDGSVGLVTFTGGTLNWSAGTIKSEFTPPPAGAFNAPDFILDGGVTANLTNSSNFAGPFDLYVNSGGTMTISTSNNINVGNGNTITNGGTIDVQSDVGFAGMQFRGQGEFDNSKIFKKSAGTGQTGVQMPFKNLNALAEFSVQSGTVYLFGSGTQTAGTTTIFAGTTLGVADTYEVAAGTLKSNGPGTATVTGNLKLSGGDFYVGTDGTIGTFFVTNNYTQTGGTLHIDVDGAQTQQSDLLKIGNLANLGGNLTVNTLNFHSPGTVFDILTYATHLNDFASITYLGGVSYTAIPGLTAYELWPPA
ncbi:MAG: hypothetical protein HYS12_16825 [Planctomycetes bacterium]|nr:hypothetical protein [Planctomycetota bacterium]